MNSTDHDSKYCTLPSPPVISYSPLPSPPVTSRHVMQSYVTPLLFSSPFTSLLTPVRCGGSVAVRPLQRLRATDRQAAFSRLSAQCSLQPRCSQRNIGPTRWLYVCACVCVVVSSFLLLCAQKCLVQCSSVLLLSCAMFILRYIKCVISILRLTCFVPSI